jgi:hypothetical protein
MNKEPHWSASALCKSDPRFVSYSMTDISEAKKICSRCSVRSDCIKSTSDNGSFFMAAGTTRLDRLMLSRREVESIDESIIGSPEIAISKVLQRER